MEKGQPLVSILLCTYNRAHLISESIESVISQTYRNWELLIINNGSTDHTKQAVSRVTDIRVKYCELERNEPTGKARNRFIRQSGAELIAFTDDDDLWAPEKLERQVELLLTNPSAGFCYSNVCNFKDGAITEYLHERKEGHETANIFELYCLGRRGIFLQSLVCYKSSIEKAGYFKEDRQFTDYGFIGNLAFHFTAVLSYEPLLKRRIHNTNSINTYSESLRKEHALTIRHYVKEGMLKKNLGADSVFLMYMNTGGAFAKTGKWLNALTQYALAFKCKPTSPAPLKKIVLVLLAIPGLTAKSKLNTFT